MPHCVQQATIADFSLVSWSCINVTLGYDPLAFRAEWPSFCAAAEAVVTTLPSMTMIFDLISS